MTQENYSPERFQEWLSDQMEARDWSQAKLAREIDVFKGTVGRWLMPADSEMHRRPSFESARRLADLFGVDLRFVLDLVGIQGYDREGELSQLQRDTIALVELLPDEVLVTVYPQLRALIDEGVRREVQERLRKVVKSDVEAR